MENRKVNIISMEELNSNQYVFNIEYTDVRGQPNNRWFFYNSLDNSVEFTDGTEMFNKLTQRIISAINNYLIQNNDDYSKN